MILKSIRWRIQAWHGALLVCMLTGMLGTFYIYERNERLREVDSHLASLLTPILPAVSGHRPMEPRRGPSDFDRPPGPPDAPAGPPDGPDGPDPREGRPPPPEGDGGRGPMQRAFAELDKGPFYYVAWGPNHEVSKKSAGAPDITFPPEEANTRDTIRERNNFRELIHYGPSGDCVLLGASVTDVTAGLHQLAVELVLAGLALVVFGLVGGWYVAGLALRPIAEISAAAEEIATGDRSKRIDVTDTESELGKMALVLNRTFDRLEAIFEQQVQFTADASHELRTPISVILTQIQLSLSRERSAEDYKRTLKTCEQAAERVRTLINSLLELARLDSGEFEVSLEECDLSRVASEALEFIGPLARKKCAILKDSVEAVTIKGDSVKLGQVFVNLLNNAIHHNSEGVEVSLSIKRNGTHVHLSIADNGCGIPTESLPHLFDRFYRADKSRSRAKGGSGLGLAISKAIIEAHRGTIRCESVPGKGTKFLIDLPLGE